uniref:Uncharacterized protein n=1 Tax=Rhizophora mucronata TaxID=61149 RepID=A0A2P2QV78_RHIMU
MIKIEMLRQPETIVR